MPLGKPRGLAAINGNSYHMGMHFAGALKKHLLISGQSDIDYKAPTRFETMNAWYRNREDLMAIETELSAGMKKSTRIDDLSTVIPGGDQAGARVSSIVTRSMRLSAGQ